MLDTLFWLNFSDIGRAGLNEVAQRWLREKLGERWEDAVLVEFLDEGITRVQCMTKDAHRWTLPVWQEVDGRRCYATYLTTAHYVGPAPAELVAEVARLGPRRSTWWCECCCGEQCEQCEQ